MEKNGGTCELQNAEQKWSGKVEKRDGIHAEGEGKESQCLGRVGVGFRGWLREDSPRTSSSKGLQRAA